MIIQASGGVTSSEGSQGPKGDRGLSARVAEGDVLSGATVQRTLIHPADGVQAGDTLIDGHGDLYTVTEVTDETVTVGAAIPDASLKGPQGERGPQGEKGDGADLHFDTASSFNGDGSENQPYSVRVANGLQLLGDGIAVNAGEGLEVEPETDGVVKLAHATPSSIGGISVGAGLHVAEDDQATLEVALPPDGGIGMDSNLRLTLSRASATSLGGVKIGSGINVTSDGTISVAGGDPADTLILIAQAQSQSVDGDKAAAAACKTVDETPLTLQQLAANPTVLAKVKANPTAMTVLRMSSDAMSLLGLSDVDVASETEMNRLAADADKLAAFCRNARLLARMARTPVNTGTVNVLKAINKSTSLLQTVWQSVTASGWFTAKSISSQDSVPNLNQYGTASAAANCIILTATGYWSSDTQHTNVFVNNTQISDGTLVNTNRPSTVTKTNIGAVSLPVTTWTETGDAYAAMGSYTGLDLGDSIWQYPDQSSLTTAGVTFTRSGASVTVKGESSSSAWPIYGKSVTLAAGKYHLAISGATNVKAEVKTSSTPVLSTFTGSSSSIKFEATLSAGTYSLNVFVQPRTTVDETVTPYLVKLS